MALEAAKLVTLKLWVGPKATVPEAAVAVSVYVDPPELNIADTVVLKAMPDELTRPIFRALNAPVLAAVPPIAGGLAR
jgi:hypothetical protein